MLCIERDSKGLVVFARPGWGKRVRITQRQLSLAVAHYFTGHHGTLPVRRCPLCKGSWSDIVRRAKCLSAPSVIAGLKECPVTAVICGEALQFQDWVRENPDKAGALKDTLLSEGALGVLRLDHMRGRAFDCVVKYGTWWELPEIDEMLEYARTHTRPRTRM